uniref:Uncharacterized protein n=1 Tax=Rhizophora mucronata TaxID=61149 RepID=A0A2P2NHA1_RHIMU
MVLHCFHIFYFNPFFLFFLLIPPYLL